MASASISGLTNKASSQVGLHEEIEVRVVLPLLFALCPAMKQLLFP